MFDLLDNTPEEQLIKRQNNRLKNIIVIGLTVIVGMIIFMYKNGMI